MTLNTFETLIDSAPVTSTEPTAADLVLLKAGAAQLVANSFSTNVNFVPDPWDYSATVVAARDSVNGGLLALAELDAINFRAEQYRLSVKTLADNRSVVGNLTENSQRGPLAIQLTRAAEAIAANMREVGDNAVRTAPEPYGTVTPLMKLTSIANTLTRISLGLSAFQIMTKAHDAYHGNDGTTNMEIMAVTVGTVVGIAVGIAATALIGTTALAAAPAILAGAATIAFAYGLGKLAEGAYKSWYSDGTDHFNTFGGWIGRTVYDWTHPSNDVGDNFTAAQRWVPRRDPLTLDLDGDGLETSGVSVANPILFSHTGDGVKTSTGWVKPDDGFLVLDRDANGRIDDGTELFGDSTPLTGGGSASDGFAALAQEDSNGDGAVDRTDARWNDLRVWRDLNQDAISQAHELFTLGELNITSIKVGSTVHSLALPDGNRIADLGSFTRGDGSRGTLGEVGQMADIDLAQDTFSSQFGATIPLAPGIDTLPNMKGSGQVRALQQAASIDNAAGAELRNKLAVYSAATTRAEQRSLLDDLIHAWGATSTLLTSGDIDRGIDDTGRQSQRKGVEAFAWNHPEEFKMITTLERFNGRTILFGWAVPGGNTGIYSISKSPAQDYFLQRSYDRLRESVYGSIALQTRLKHYLASPFVVADEMGVRYDTSALTGTLAALAISDPGKAITDLQELNRYAAADLRLWGYQDQSLNMLQELVRAVGADSPLQATLSELGIKVGPGVVATHLDDFLFGHGYFDAIAGGDGNDILLGMEGNDEMDGQAGDDTLYGGTGDDGLYGDTGNDILYGGSGNDRLWGGDGDDLLEGGAGNDRLHAGNGNDVYLFGRGDGQDVINIDITAATQAVTVRFRANVATTDIVVRQPAYDPWSDLNGALELLIAGTSDKITINRFFGNDDVSTSVNGVQQVIFADGTIWNADSLARMAMTPTEGNDQIRATSGDDTLFGLAGDDKLDGAAGIDSIDGGAGRDLLFGGHGDDILIGGLGNDELAGDAGDDVLDGGAGDDRLIDSVGNDTFLFGKGDGRDVVVYNKMDYTRGKLTTLQFKAGVLPSEITIVQSSFGQDVILGIAGTADQITFPVHNWRNDPANLSHNGIYQVKFDDGTMWDLGTLQALLYAGTPGNDIVHGDDRGNKLTGGLGADQLSGGQGNDLLDGGVGDDTLNGSGGDDTLDGGGGNDLLYGGTGSNVFRFGKGDGQDRVVNSYWNGGTVSTVAFKEGISPSELLLKQVYDVGNMDYKALEISISGTGDKIVIDGFMRGEGLGNPYNPVQQFTFFDGTLWNLAAIQAKLLETTAGNDSIQGTAASDFLNGGAGNDVLSGDAGDDLLEGGEGEDRLFGGIGNDALEGGAGGDYLAGEAGNDTLRGGEGNDDLVGGAGNDTLDGGAGVDKLNAGEGDNIYLFGRGDGKDSIHAYDHRFDKLNTLQLKAGVLPSEVAVRQVVDPVYSSNSGARGALEVSIVGTDDAVTILGFFYDQEVVTDYNGVQRLKFEDGTIWDLAKLQAMVLVPTELADHISGTQGANVLFGAAGDDTLLGLGGDDTLTGGLGNDVLYGGAGNNTYVFQRGDGQDIILNQSVSNALIGNVLQFGEGIVAADVRVERLGGALMIRFAGSTDSVAIGNFFAMPNSGGEAPGLKEIRFHDGSVWNESTLAPMLMVGSSGNDQLGGFGSSDTIDGKLGDDTLYGAGGDDALTGGLGSDRLYGEAGNDSIDGGAGEDDLDGGYGRNTFHFGRGYGRDIISTKYTYGQNQDVIRMASDVTVGDVTVTRFGTSLVLGIGSSSDTLVVQDYFSWGVGSCFTIEFADGTSWGSAAVNVKAVQRYNSSPTPSSNVLKVFGKSDQPFSYTVAPDAITDPDVWQRITYKVKVKDGAELPAWLTFDPATRVLSGTPGEANVGTLGLMLWGNDGSTSSAGRQIIMTIDLTVPNRAPVVVVPLQDQPAFEGVAFSYSIPSNAFVDLDEGDSLTYTAALANGAELPAWLAFDPLSASFSGVPPSVGTFSVVLTATDSANLSATSVFDLFIQVVENIAPVLAAPLSDQTVSPGTEFRYSIPENAFVDFDSAHLDFSATMADGSALPDWLAFDPMARTFSGVPTATGVTSVRVTATDSAQAFVSDIFDVVVAIRDLTLNGTANADSLIGGAGNDTLNGLAGNDMLNGGVGSDRMVGGTGDDNFVVDNVGDVVIEGTSAGNDTIQSGIGWILGANVENLTLIGTASINATGNTLANRLIGNVGGNILNGGGGIDTMVGGLGDDIYIVDNSADVTTEVTLGGADSVHASVSYTISANVEALTLTGVAAINGTGNANDNTVIGNSAINTLTGGAGNDRLDGMGGADKLLGGLGDDTYIVDAVGDLVTESASQGVDLVQSSITHTLVVNVEALTLTGAAAINGTGNAHDNLLIGNSANNVLAGGAGNDIMQGGGGSDTLQDTAGKNLFDGGSGNDSLAGGIGNELFIGGAGNDVITTSTGADVIAFNRGDGQDVVNGSTGKDNTVSLGNGITYADLLFRKTGNDLILVTGIAEQLTFKDWYVSANNRNVANLQVVIEGSSDYNPTTGNALTNKKVERFNLDGMVTAFDQARLATPGMTTWGLSASMLTFHLGGSDTTAIGGDLAYQYAKNGSLSTLSLTPAVAVLTSAQFGSGTQALLGTSALRDLTPSLI